MVKQDVFRPLDNNCYLLVDDKTNQSALIDCSEFNQRMVDLIGDTDLKYILLTHGHFDHIGGVEQVKEKYGCKVVISNDDAHMLDVGADIFVGEGDVIELGNTKIEVMSTPGHTKGSVCYIADDNLFTGDTLFCCSCGRTDLPSGSDAEMLSSLRRLKGLNCNYNIYAGHDENSTLDFERKNNPYLKL